MDDGLIFSGTIEPPDVTADPAGDDWRGPPGPAGPPGPHGPAGIDTVFNALEHGVMMDGVTDDHAALNALAALAGGEPGAVVYFPPSPTPLLLSNAVNIPSNQTWWAYPGSVIIQPTAGNAASIMLFATASTSNVYIHGLTFDGGGRDFVNGNVVTQAYRVNGMTLDRVTYQNTRGIAFNGSGNNDLIARGCVFRNIGNHWKTTGNPADRLAAFSNSNGDGVTWGFRTRVEGCSFFDIGLDPINLGFIKGAQVIGNTFVPSPGQFSLIAAPDYPSAIFPPGCSQVVITGNYARGAAGNGIDAPALTDALISGNIFRECGSEGIALFPDASSNGCHNVTITGNVLENNGQSTLNPASAGLVIGLGNSSTQTTSNVYVAGNIITDTQTAKTQQYGVVLEGAAQPGVWIDIANQLTGNGTGQTLGITVSGVPATANFADNSGFSVNQRGYASGAARAAGLYGLDRWKAGAGGCTITFAALAGPSRTVTITAGTLQQVIEGASLAGGNYMLSWSGTAQGRVGAGSYAASPVPVSGVAAGANTTIEFNAGTLGQVKFEAGNTATPWIANTARNELSNCLRFYQIALCASRFTASGAGANVANSVAWQAMRAMPAAGAPTGAASSNATAATLSPYSPNGGSFNIQSVAAGDCYVLGSAYPLTADL